MEVLHSRNVNDAYASGLELLKRVGVREESRAGPVLVAPTPVTTVYERPRERVLLDPRRDANPFFHVFESLHMLAGRNDAPWLDQFVGNFSSRFAEDSGRQHGAYGFRWRNHFEMEGGGHPALPDQLDTVVRLLRENPDDRRVVLSMWDPVADLDADKRDIPCNLMVIPRIRRNTLGVSGMHGEMLHTAESVLDITVCCRSNDAVWGAYGANAVHFSVLQEYLAGRIGASVGRYYQVSNNFHGYVDVLDKVGVPDPVGDYPGTQPMGHDWTHWDSDLAKFMAWSEAPDLLSPVWGDYVNSWFSDTAEPLFVSHALWKQGNRQSALSILYDAENMAPDWKLAARQWFERRLK